MVDSAAETLPIGPHDARRVSIRWRDKRVGPRGWKEGRRKGGARACRQQQVAAGAEGNAPFPPCLIAPPGRRDAMFLGLRRGAAEPKRPYGIGESVSPCVAACRCRASYKKAALGGGRLLPAVEPPGGSCRPVPAVASERQREGSSRPLGTCLGTIASSSFEFNKITGKIFLLYVILLC